MAALRKYLSPLNLALAALVAVGLVLRLRQYLAGRSLWLDEAMLALNLVQRDFWGLLRPLDYDQGAPLGFLLLQKLVASLLGDGELTLRLIPFLAGLVALMLYPLLLARFLKPTGQLVALALLALNPALVYYSSELKQYNLDVLAAILIALALPLAPNARLVLLGISPPWFSHPAVFLLGGLGLTMLWQARRDRPRLARLAGVIGLWLISFGLLAASSLGGLMSNRYLLDYWAEFFMPLSMNAPAWLWEQLTSLFTSPSLAGLALPGGLALGLAALGGFRLARRDEAPWLGIFVLPLLFALAASALGKYPFGERMLLFSIPFTLALLAAGVDQVITWVASARWGRGLEKGLALVLAGILCFGPLQTSLERLVQPVMRENMHPALAALRQQRRPGDSVYIYYGAVPAFLYYAPRYGFDPEQFQPGRFRQQAIPVTEILDEMKPLRGQPRAWVLFSHVYEKDAMNQQQQLMAALEEWGKCKTQSREKGTSVTLYLCNLE